jgi:hypothetical protein
MIDSCTSEWKSGIVPEHGAESDAGREVFDRLAPCDRGRYRKLHAFVKSPAWMPGFAFAVMDDR